MTLKELYEKHIEESSRQKKKVDLSIRRSYAEVPDTIRFYFIKSAFSFLKLAICGSLILLTLFFLNLIGLGTAIVIANLWLVTIGAIYTLSPRVCSTCSGKMVRQMDDRIYYFCDNCRKKIKNKLKGESNP